MAVATAAATAAFRAAVSMTGGGGGGGGQGYSWEICEEASFSYKFIKIRKMVRINL